VQQTNCVGYVGTANNIKPRAVQNVGIVGYALYMANNANHYASARTWCARPCFAGAYCMVLALLAELSVPTAVGGLYNYLPVYLYSIY
jgi:hypothetical protein